MPAPTTVAVAAPQAEVCLLAKDGVTQPRLCDCGKTCRPRGKKCSACSQSAYREGEAHAACLLRQREVRAKDRAERRSGLSRVFDGRLQGKPRNIGRTVPYNTSGLIGWVDPIKFKEAV